MPQVWGLAVSGSSETRACIQQAIATFHDLHGHIASKLGSWHLVCRNKELGVAIAWVLSKESLTEAVNVEKTAQEDANIHTRVHLNASENGAAQPKNHAVQVKPKPNIIWVRAGLGQND